MTMECLEIYNASEYIIVTGERQLSRGTIDPGSSRGLQHLSAGNL